MYWRDNEHRDHNHVYFGREVTTGGLTAPALAVDAAGNLQGSQVHAAVAVTAREAMLLIAGEGYAVLLIPTLR